MRLTELLDKLNDLYNEAKKPCEDCTVLNCDKCPVNIVWKGEEDVRESD